MSTKIEKLIDNLQECQNVSYDTPSIALKSNAKAERTLDLIFEIGKRGLSFTETEKRAIGPLVVGAIKPIKKNIERAWLVHRTRLDSSVLRKRSALQFLVDTYGSFPSGDTTLANVFSRVNIKEHIGLLEEVIAKWRDESDSDDVPSDPDTSGLPTSHTWWDK